MVILWRHYLQSFRARIIVCDYNILTSCLTEEKKRPGALIQQNSIYVINSIVNVLLLEWFPRDLLEFPRDLLEWW